MSQQWYVNQNGRTHGPVTAPQLKKLVGDGKVGRDTRIRLGEEGRWLEAGKVKGLFPVPTGKSKTTPSTTSSATPNPIVTETPSRATTKAASAKIDSADPYRPPAPIDESVGEPSLPSDDGSIDGLGAALRSIWFRPRHTIRWAIASRPGRDAIFMIMIAFSLKYLDNVVSSGDPGTIAFGLLGSIIGIPFSALIGIVVLYFMGFMHKIIGGVFGGSGDSESLRTAFAWSFVPMLLSFPLTVLVVGLFLTVPASHSIPDIVINLPFWILGFWGLVIEIAGISAAHRFSIIRAIATALITIVVLALAVLIIVQLSIMMVIG